MRFDESVAWRERARQVIPCGTQTMSKSPTQFVQGVSPIYLQRGAGAHVWDVDGNEFIDYPMALGPVLLGHADSRVNQAISRQLEEGITFTLSHPLEVEVAEMIVSTCPGVEAVRFGKSGSDVLSAAVRAARAITGRDHLAVGGYHGWHDWFIGSTSRSAGVPASTRQLTHPFAWGDIDSLESTLDSAEFAAVVLEPSGSRTPPPGYLADVVEVAHRNGALVIFDEVIVGFRVAPGGARERYGVEPDFSCYGKALGNGMPISAIAGRWTHMGVFEEVFFSGTHGGEALSLAAAKCVLEVITETEALQRIASLGGRLQEGMAAILRERGCEERISVGGEPQRTVVEFAAPDGLLTKSWIQQCFARAGILFNGSMFICEQHTRADIDTTLEVFDDALRHLRTITDVRSHLAGPPIQAIFTSP